MQYEIKYDWTGRSRHITTTKKWAIRVGISLCVIALCVVVIWSMNADWAVTVDALDNMAGALQDGSRIQDAFSGFCLDILKGAKIG